MYDHLVIPFIVFMVVLVATAHQMNEKESKTREDAPITEVIEPPELW